MSQRLRERIVGVLFVVATVGSIAASAVQGSILEGPGYLSALASHDGRLIGAALVFIVAAVSALGTALLLYPILRTRAEGLAIGYVALRMFENILYLGGVVTMLSMLTVAQGDAVAIEQSNGQLVGETLLAVQHWSVSIGTLLFFGFGAWTLNHLLYRFRMVPRWLSGWGVAGSILVIGYGLAAVLGADVKMGSPLMLLAMPIAFQEMVFAGWLIARGMVNGSTRTATATRELVSVT